MGRSAADLRASPCQTLTHALQLIDEAQARDVVLTATVGAKAGMWVGERYPVVLGWGVELSASGISFGDGDVESRDLFEIGAVSPNDLVGYASVIGAEIGNPTSDRSTILVDPGSTLYLASASIFSNAADETTAIEVSAGAGLVLGQDHSGGITGTVEIGPEISTDSLLGYNGIVLRRGQHTRLHHHRCPPSTAVAA